MCFGEEGPEQVPLQFPVAHAIYMYLSYVSIYAPGSHPADWCYLVCLCNVIHRHVTTSHFDLMHCLLSRRRR